MPPPTAGMLKISLALKRWFINWGTLGGPPNPSDEVVLQVFATKIRANAGSRYEDNPSIPALMKQAATAHLRLQWHTALRDLKAGLKKAGYDITLKDIAATKKQSLEAFPDVPAIWVWDIISLVVDLKTFGPIQIGTTAFRPEQTLSTCLKWIARLDAGDASSKR